MAEGIKFTVGLDPTNVEPNAKKVERSLQGMGRAGETSAKQIAAATRTLPAQFTDIATQLAGGQSPFLVLLQQGGQIKDSFGGVGNALRGIAGAISPVGLAVGAAVGAVAGLATAALAGRRETEALRDTLILTGNAAGLTADRVSVLSKTLEGNTQQTLGSAREIVTALAATGQTSSRVIESQATAVARLADLTGKAGKDIAATFAGQLEAPTKFAAKLNEAYNFLSVADFKRIQALERGKKAAEAANLTNDLLVKSLAVQRDQLGTLEKAWDSLTKAISGAKQALLDLGKPQTIQGAIDEQFKRLQGLQTQLATNTQVGRGEAAIPGLGSQNDGIRQQIRAAQRRLFELSRQAEREQLNADARSETAAGNREKINDLLGGAKPLELGAIRDPKAQYRADFLRSEKQFYQDLEDEQKKLRELLGKDPLGEFITERVLPDAERRAQERLTQQSAILQQLVDENERAGAELLTGERERGRALIEIDRQVAIRRLQQQELSNDVLLQAIEEVNTRADIALRGLNQGVLQKEAAAADATSQSMADSISTGILEGFRRGNSLADIFLGELKAQFATTVLSPLIRPVVDAGNEGSAQLLASIGSALSGNSLTIDTGGLGLNPGAGDFATGTAIRGRRAMGGPVQAGGAYLVGENGPEVLQMGGQSGYVHANGAMGGITLNSAPVIHIDARADQAQVMQLVAAGVQQGNRALLEHLRVQGVTR